jgi:peptide/nickel transport system substrate-binding protein
VLLAPSDSITERTLAEAVVAQLANAGLRVVLQQMLAPNRMSLMSAGQFDWSFGTADTEFIVVVQGTAQLAPLGPQIHRAHRAGTDGTLDLLPFEEELVSIVGDFTDTNDAASRVALMRRYQRVFTENVYAFGLVQYPAALILNKRFANVPPGSAGLMFNGPEESIIPERIYVPRDRQASYELYPGSLPGQPGSDGPLTP